MGGLRHGRGMGEAIQGRGKGDVIHGRGRGMRLWEGEGGNDFGVEEEVGSGGGLGRECEEGNPPLNYLFFVREESRYQSISRRQALQKPGVSTAVTNKIS